MSDSFTGYVHGYGGSGMEYYYGPYIISEYLDDDGSGNVHKLEIANLSAESKNITITIRFLNRSDGLYNSSQDREEVIALTGGGVTAISITDTGFSASTGYVVQEIRYSYNNGPSNSGDQFIDNIVHTPDYTDIFNKRIARQFNILTPMNPYNFNQWDHFESDTDDTNFGDYPNTGATVHSDPKVITYRGISYWIPKIPDKIYRYLDYSHNNHRLFINVQIGSIDGSTFDGQYNRIIYIYNDNEYIKIDLNNGMILDSSISSNITFTVNTINKKILELVFNNGIIELTMKKHKEYNNNIVNINLFIKNHKKVVNQYLRGAVMHKQDLLEVNTIADNSILTYPIINMEDELDVIYISLD